MGVVHIIAQEEEKIKLSPGQARALALVKMAEEVPCKVYMSMHLIDDAALRRLIKFEIAEALKLSGEYGL